MNAPCKDCEFRKPATKDSPSCHADCTIYAAWKNELDYRKKQIINQNMIGNYESNRTKRIKKMLTRSDGKHLANQQ